MSNTPTDTRETLKSFLNSDQNSISFSHGKPAGDNINLDGSDDIKLDPNSEKTLLGLDDNSSEGILGDYISFIAENSNSIFKLKPGVEKSSETKRGESLDLGKQGAAIIFTDTVEDGVEFSRYSNSQFSNLNDIINKIGREGADGSDGHRLLSTINEEEVNEVTKAVENDVLSKSRFGNIQNKEVFSEQFENNDSFENKDNFKINKSYGKYTELDTDALVKLEQLKKLGASLLLKSSGFDDSLLPGNSINPEGYLNDNEINSKLNNENTLTSTDALRSKNAFGFPTNKNSDESIRDGRGYVLDDGTRNTIGSAYNTEMHFNGKNKKLLKIQAALSLVVVRNMAQSLYSSFLKEYDTSGDLSEDISVVENEFKGSNLINPILGSSKKMLNLRTDFVIANLLVPTKYPYFACFKRGLKILFDDNLNLNTILESEVDAEIIKDYKKSSGLGQSPGFWLAVSRSIINSSKNIINNIDMLNNDNSDSIENFINYLSSNNVIGYMNSIATVGDASFQAYSGELILESNFYKRSRNVDSLPDGPGTRVSKSRKDNGYRENQLAWSQNDVPSAYLLPLNVIRAAGRLDKTISGPNPFTAMVGSELVENTYFSKNMDGSSNRIPKEVVKTLENKLDAEYVPFYIQDLRTNEIISFHAFLNQLTDTINPDFSTFSGYGRLDPVRIYKGTTRSLQIGFTLLATSKEDFNSMWYKINKLVTLLYPQWTKGTLVGKDLGGGVSSKFVQPNTQVLGASPLVRLRVGDIIKSNYSKFNLARMFGIGDGDVQPLTDNPSVANSLRRNIGQSFSNAIKDISTALLAYVFGSPIQFFNINSVKMLGNTSNIASKSLSGLSSVATNYLKNGFVNPLTLGLVLNKLKNPNVNKDNISNVNFDLPTAGQNLGETINNSLKDTNLNGLPEHFPVYLKGNNIEGYLITGVDGADTSIIGKKLFIRNPIKVKITGKESINNRIYYIVQVIDFSMPTEAFNIKLKVDPAYIYQIPNDILVNTLEFGILLAGTGGFINPALDFGLRENVVKGFSNATGIAPLVDVIRHLYQSEESNFMDSFNNPFVKAYESSMGRGLAGTLGSINFDWLDDSFPWEIDHNSRAPIGCKISFGFDVIHDLPPGLDHSGYNRAPLYNVGDIMKNISGDVYESFYKEDEFEFRKQSNKGVKITGKK